MTHKLRNHDLDLVAGHILVSRLSISFPAHAIPMLFLSYTYVRTTHTGMQ